MKFGRIVSSSSKYASSINAVGLFDMTSNFHDGGVVWRRADADAYACCCISPSPGSASAAEYRLRQSGSLIPWHIENRTPAVKISNDNSASGCPQP